MLTYSFKRRPGYQNLLICEFMLKETHLIYSNKVNVLFPLCIEIMSSIVRTKH